MARTWRRRGSLSHASALGGSVSASGRVQKVVKRDGFRLVVEADEDVVNKHICAIPRIYTDFPFVVFADFGTAAETVRNSKIQKGSAVRVTGKLLSFGWSAVCLGSCRVFTKTICPVYQFLPLSVLQLLFWIWNQLIFYCRRKPPRCFPDDG